MKIDRKQLVMKIVDVLGSMRQFSRVFDGIGMGDAFDNVDGFVDVHEKLEDLIFELLCVPADNTTSEPASSLMDLVSSGQLTGDEFDEAWDKAGCFCRDEFSQLLYDINCGEEQFDSLWDATAEFRKGVE